MDVDAQDLLHALLAVGLLHRLLVGQRVGVARAQSHVAGEDAMAVTIADRLEGIPFGDRRREGREEVVAERRTAAFLPDRLLDLAGGAAS